MYLLDTDHCGELFKANQTIIRKLQLLDEAVVATCVVVSGKMLLMGYRSELREENLFRINSFLTDLIVYPLDDAAADAYARIKAGLLDRFGPRAKAARRQFDLAKLGLKDNDLWIASVAQSRGFTVVSGDRDFSRISEVSGIPIENWLAETG